MKFLAFAILVFVCLVWIPVEFAWRDFCFNNYDLGIYAQAIELLGFGNPNPWLSTRDVHLFNDHFDPVLFLLLPFKGLLPTSLLAIRVEMISLLAASLAPFWLWRLGRIPLDAAAVAASIILFSPMTLDATFYPAHPGTWSLAPFSWMFAFILAERFGFSLVMLLVLLACKEEYPFVGFVVGVCIARLGHRRAGLSFMLISSLWAIMVFLIRPAVLGPSSMYTEAVSGFQGLQMIFSSESGQTAFRRLWEIILPMSVVFYGARNLPWKRAAIPIAAALVLISIRLAGGYWGNHRVAPLSVALAYTIIYGFETLKLSAWRKVAFAIIMVALAFPSLELGTRFLRGKPFKKHCTPNVERLAEIERALDVLRRTSSGAVLAQGNLIPRAVDLPGISHAGATKSRLFSYLFIEKGENRNSWPLSEDGLKELEATWRVDPRVRVTFEGQHVLILGRDP